MSLSRKNLVLTIVFTLILIITVVPFYSDLVYKGLPYALYRPGLFILILLVATWPWRTIPPRLMLLSFLLGGSVVMAVTLLIQTGLVAILNLIPETIMRSVGLLFGAQINIRAMFVAPVTEEILKVLPILIILFVGPWKYLRRTAGPLDFALLGAALGGGFQFTETVFMQRGASWALPTTFISPLLPTLEPWYPGIVHWFGHAGTTATLALAIGIAIRLAAKRKVWWILPVPVASLVIFEHFLVAFASRPEVLWLRALATIDRYGLLASNLFVVGMIVSMILSTKILLRYRKVDPEANIDFKATIQAITSSKTELFTRTWAVLLLSRLKLALAFGFDNLGRDKKVPDSVALSMDRLRQAYLTLKKAIIERKELPQPQPTS